MSVHLRPKEAQKAFQWKHLFQKIPIIAYFESDNQSEKGN